MAVDGTNASVDDNCYDDIAADHHIGGDVSCKVLQK